MQRQRGKLGNLADLPGPVQAIRKTPPPARRYCQVKWNSRVLEAKSVVGQT